MRKSVPVTVGAAGCDIRGFTNTHIQGAVDGVGARGGGEVLLSPGVFRMADSLHLRSRVTVRGAGQRTVLHKNAMKSARIAVYLGYGHYDLIVDRPSVFAVGDGVLLRDDNAPGFYTTVSTLLRREGDVWITSRPHNHDYRPTAHGVAETLFPVVAAVDVDDAALEGVRIEGNRRGNPVAANGCRAGGFLALRSNRLRLRRLWIHDYHGDGLSFQTCDDADIAQCIVDGCTGNGIHPGSGSNRFALRRCTVRGNRGCGIFYCLRACHGRIEDCRIERNGGHGVSIGERDADNANRRLVIRNNSGAGIFFRLCDRRHAPHRTVFEDCILERNNAAGAAAEVVLQGEADAVRIVRNTLRPRAGGPAIVRHPGPRAARLSGNRILSSE